MKKANGIAFENLRAEMARKQLSIEELAVTLSITKDTLEYKLSRKKPINLDEAMYIAKEFFPECDLFYLFKELIPQSHPS